MGGRLCCAAHLAAHLAPWRLDVPACHAACTLRPTCRQDLPPAENAGLPSQLFAIIVAIFGLASFALVLALIEQVRGDSGCDLVVPARCGLSTRLCSAS